MRLAFVNLVPLWLCLFPSDLTPRAFPRGVIVTLGPAKPLALYKPTLDADCSFFLFFFFSRATSGRRDQALQQQPSPRSAAAACFLSNYRCVTCTSGRLHVSTSLCLSWHILWSQQLRLQGTALPCPPSLGISISMLTGAPGERCAKGQHDNCQQPALISWGLFIKRLCWVWLH